MLLALIGFLAGFALGWRRAGRRGGAVADKLQFAIAHGVALALLGLIASVLMVNMGV